MTNRRRVTARLVAVFVTAAIVGGWTVLRRGRDGLIPGSAGVFQVKPYLQPGDTPSSGSNGGDSLALIWQTDDRDAAWSVEVRGDTGGTWTPAAPPSSRRVAVEGMPPFRLYRATLEGLAPGSEFAYRVRRGGNPVFEARARARTAAGAAQRFVVFGDAAAGTSEQRAVALQAFQARPDYLVIVGDVVYMRGRVSEYLDHFFPVYNADRPSASGGVPLLRSVLCYAVPGNHDLVECDLDKFPDGAAYYYYWAPPGNGPLTALGAPGTPQLKGSDARRRAFLTAVGPAFPRAGCYSFDHGGAHWTVLDSNAYADLTDPALLAWLEADLAAPAARAARWRFAAFHHPAFHSSRAHKDDQRMRLIAPALERGKVDLVFSGHVHNYQRSRPIRFAPDPLPPGSHGAPYGPGGQVGGVLTLDRTYDGVHQTWPDGIIYIVTGGGGARLYDPRQGDVPGSWQPYTVRFVSSVHSLTVVDVDPRALTVRQVADDGRELDHFVVTR
jgi:acid phosphatase type 7